MNISVFSKGIILASIGSFWWGIIGTIYFHHFSYIGHIELVIHRCIWTSLVLILTTIYYNKWSIFTYTIKSKKNYLYYFSLVFLSLVIGVDGYMLYQPIKLLMQALGTL